jgi:hypothetical protein
MTLLSPSLDRSDGSGRPMDGLRTEFDFLLPRGYVDARGRVHRRGSMRLATARDEIAPQADPRVRANPAYLTVLLLARTITAIEGVDEVGTDVVEELFAADLAFLQEMYRQVNQRGDTRVELRCPACAHDFTVDPATEAASLLGAVGDVGEA